MIVQNQFGQEGVRYVRASSSVHGIQMLLEQQVTEV